MYENLTIKTVDIYGLEVVENVSCTGVLESFTLIHKLFFYQ